MYFSENREIQFFYFLFKHFLSLWVKISKIEFFEIFEIESFITIGNATEEFKVFAAENGFNIEYRESIGGFVRR